MADYGQIKIDLTGVTATSDLSLRIQIQNVGFTFGGTQDLSFEGILGVTGITVSPKAVTLEVSSGATLGGVLTLYATTTTKGGNDVALTANASDFSTGSSKSFDVTWSTNSGGIQEGNLISGNLTLGDFGPE